MAISIESEGTQKMAVLVEGISVVVSCAAISRSHSGGLAQFQYELPNKSFCADGELACVRFMTPIDVHAYVKQLESRGLSHVRASAAAADLVIVDQLTGFRADCDWAEFGMTSLKGDPQFPIAVCRALPSSVQQVSTPLGWTFETSLSAHGRFAPGNQLPPAVKFLRREAGIDVYLDETTGQELFVGRAQPPT